MTSVGLPREGTRRRSPPLLAGFLEQKRKENVTEWGCTEGMSQVKRKSQRMEKRENAALKTDKTSKRKARVNKRND